jgi:hypothetical protein
MTAYRLLAEHSLAMPPSSMNTASSAPLGHRFVLGQHVGEQRDRLDPAPLPPLVGDAPELDAFAGAGRELGQRAGVEVERGLAAALGEQVVARADAAGELEVDHPLADAGLADELADLLCERVDGERHADLDAGGALAEALEVFGKRERLAVVEADDLVHASANCEPRSSTPGRASAMGIVSPLNQISSSAMVVRLGLRDSSRPTKPRDCSPAAWFALGSAATLKGAASGFII